MPANSLFKKNIFIWFVLLLITTSLFATDISYTNIHNFAGGTGDGEIPYGSIIISHNTIFGMSNQGGVNDCGVIFKMNINGSNYVNLHEFAGGAGDGKFPYYGKLTLNGDTLYGMTTQGGTNNYGVIFKINTNGNAFATLHEFMNNDGANPYGSLLLADNTLYGMTKGGGINNRGTIFKFDIVNNNFSTLYKFPTDINYGMNPYGSLLLYDNKLYGMAYEGGQQNKGVIFKIDKDGGNYTNLHVFNGVDDGGNPYGSLIFYNNTFFGMTKSGGTNSSSGYGVIFKMDIDGNNYSCLHKFNYYDDGRYPYGDLITSGDMLYGMISDGYTCKGAIFQIDINGENYTNIHNFALGISNGNRPFGSLAFYNNEFYGMTSQGGSHAKGVIFKQLQPEIPEPYSLFCFIFMLLIRNFSKH